MSFWKNNELLSSAHKRQCAAFFNERCLASISGKIPASGENFPIFGVEANFYLRSRKNSTYSTAAEPLTACHYHTCDPAGLASHSTIQLVVTILAEDKTVTVLSEERWCVWWGTPIE